MKLRISIKFGTIYRKSREQSAAVSGGETRGKGGNCPPHFLGEEQCPPIVEMFHCISYIVSFGNFMLVVVKISHKHSTLLHQELWLIPTFHKLSPTGCLYFCKSLYNVSLRNRYYGTWFPPRSQVSDPLISMVYITLSCKVFTTKSIVVHIAKKLSKQYPSLINIT